MDDPVLLAAEARRGDFADPKLRSLAVLIKAKDAVSLEKELAGHPPPAGKDRDGNDLLAYATLMAYRTLPTCGRLRSIGCVSEAGSALPRQVQAKTLFLVRVLPQHQSQ